MSLEFRTTKLLSTISTNEDAKRAAERGEADGFVVHAEQQTAGRGRQGRVWDSPVGNLYASTLLRIDSSLQSAGHYSFITALAIADALQAFIPTANIQLKWPNDVLVDGKKISGILLEAATVVDGKVAWLVIGTGINVRHHPENAAYPTTSIIDCGGDPDLSADKVLTLFLQHLSAWCAIYRDVGFPAIRSTWLHHAKKGWLTARLPHCTYEGEFLDLDDQGRLIIRLADGAEQAIAAADIFFTP